MNVNLSGKRIFVEIIKLKMRSYWIRMGPDPLTDVLQEEDMKTAGRRPCEDGVTNKAQC